MVVGDTVQLFLSQVRKTIVCDICGENVIQRYLRRHKESRHDPTFKEREAEKRKLKALTQPVKNVPQFKCSKVCDFWAEQKLKKGVSFLWRAQLQNVVEGENTGYAIFSYHC